MSDQHTPKGGDNGTMDSRIGLDVIVENPDYISKLASAFDTTNTLVKKQVFELLSALCVYNVDGYQRALETLESYKKLKGSRYRMKLIITELDNSNAVDYSTAIMAFVNCSIISTSQLQDRVRLRNEFIGNGLLTVLNKLRPIAKKEPELAIQLDVFDEQRENDDQQSLIKGSHGGLDLNSPLDVFYAILRQVADTPQEIPFLSILQHLLRIDPKEAISDMIWDTAERLVHRATLMENKDEAARLLRSPSTTKFSQFSCMHCHRGSISDQNNTNRKPSLSVLNTNSVSTPPPPPPPPPIFKPGTIPKPPSGPISPYQILKPMTTSVVQASSVKKGSTEALEKLPQQETPLPKIKMKTINWNKIPSHKVCGKKNIWSLVANNHQHSPMADMDWSEMEGLFCQQTPPSTSAQSSPILGRHSSIRVRKDNSEITLLDGKRSLNVNIFLKQFKSSNENIIQLIKNGEHDDVGAEKLRGLLKILPEVDELDMLKSYNGDFDKLGNAEKFLIQLAHISNYKLRIETMLLKEEFATNMEYLEPSIQAMTNAIEGLMSDTSLQEVLYMVLVAGNFLNSGGYAGNAAGVKLTSLQKITDIRANKPNMNLIHYVALQVEKRNRNLLNFPNNFTVLEDASKITVEQLQNEINALDTRIKSIKKVVSLPNTEAEIKSQMTDFLIMAEREVGNLQQNMANLEESRKRLADFFCEDSTAFKLEECFKIFHSFCTRFRQAVVDNTRRRLQEEQANARRKQREEIMAAKRRQLSCGTPGSDSEGMFTEITFLDKKKKNQNRINITSDDDTSMPPSPIIRRRRIGSFNNGHQSDIGNQNISGKEEESPDITPTGSLRRRRSRVLTEEDDGNLMEYLRTASHDSCSKDRISWGSLDRSWARRARGSTPRKRPALLNADFCINRERTSPPSSFLGKNYIVPEDNYTQPSPPPVPGKEWRQQIETWLRDNESDHYIDKQNMRIGNKSSEIDSENDKNHTLVTLHEGKSESSSDINYTSPRISPGWKPSTTINKTDAVRTLEAIEDIQSNVKDKSAWRKSTLNVPNSSETTSNEINTRGQITTSPNTPDNDRKGLISALGKRPASDHLTLYMRKPTDQKLRSTILSENRTISNKIEIDSDNIETPPTTRKAITLTPVDKREPTPPTQCKRMLPRAIKEKSVIPDSVQTANAILGDGQFDRFSSARRTRRYKKPSDLNGDSEAEFLAETEVIRPTQLKSSNSFKAGQILPEDKSISDKIPIRSRFRNRTGITADDVKEAGRLIKNFNEQNKSERGTVIKNKFSKMKDHENDEGFEETHSLMSESPSQRTSSGHAYDVDLIDGHYNKIRSNLNSSVDNKKKLDSIPNNETPIDDPKKEGITSGKKSVIPRRTASLKKINSQTQILQKKPEDRFNFSTNTISPKTYLNSPVKVPLQRPTSFLPQHNRTVSGLKRISSGNLINQKPPRPSSTFMKPTTSSTTKTNITRTASRLSISSMKSAPFK